MYLPEQKVSAALWNKNNQTLESKKQKQMQIVILDDK